jgi:hypothetical protein
VGLSKDATEGWRTTWAGEKIFRATVSHISHEDVYVVFCRARTLALISPVALPASEAVEAATAGCTVCLPSGIFEDNLVIRHPIRILSRDHQVGIKDSFVLSIVSALALGLEVLMIVPLPDICIYLSKSLRGHARALHTHTVRPLTAALGALPFSNPSRQPLYPPTPTLFLWVLWGVNSALRCTRQ